MRWGRISLEKVGLKMRIEKKELQWNKKINDKNKNVGKRFCDEIVDSKSTEDFQSFDWISSSLLDGICQIT